MASNIDNVSNESFMQILNLFATIPSLITGLLMIYYCYKSMHIDSSIKLILILAISDFLYSVCNLMTIFDYSADSPACGVETFIRFFSSKFSACIVTSIALFHRQAIKMFPKFRSTRFLIISLTVSLIIGLIISIW